MPIIKGFATLLIWWHKDECIQRETQRQNLQNSTDYSLMCLICNLQVSNECSHTLAALGREDWTVQFSARSYFAGCQNYAKYFKSNSRNKNCILGRVWDTLIKHRHARRARVIFLWLKSPGGSSTRWTLNSYDKGNSFTYTGPGFHSMALWS